MTKTSISGLAVASALAAVAAMPASAQAQSGYGYETAAPMSAEEVQALPAEYRSAPHAMDYTETTVDADGVETITRTRRIERSAPYPAPRGTPHAAHGEYAEYEVEQYAYRSMPAHTPAYAPAAQVFQRDQWIDECERRTNGRGDREKGGIIGGLLGAIAGGIIGNRVADGERLAGTLIGAGTGGIAGVLLGSLIGGGRNSDGDYDCEAALDSYLSQYGYGHSGVYATRTIPAPAYAAPGYYAPAPAPAYQGYSYGYAAPAYQGYSYSYAPPHQVVYVPVRYQQQQRVIVRETVREEVIPGATRSIPEPTPAPQPQPVAPTPQPAPQPAPAPAQPQYIKGY